ncbi:hypothetical protein Ancab_000788 [Ancistrocladus abbreviatus]
MQQVEEGSSRSVDNPSPSPNPNPCPICLGSVNNDAYLDCCFHRYCYDCILRWTKVITSRISPQASSIKCPLCKTENYGIIYGYDGSTFQRHYFSQHTVNSNFFSEAHKYRLQCYYTKPGILNDTFNVTQYWKLGKYLLPNKWLQHWLKRELQALIQEEDVDIIMHHILGVIESISKRNEQKGPRRTPNLRQEEFKISVAGAARPFLTGRTERFVDEVELFLASGLTIEAYDKVYKKRLGWERPLESSENEEHGVSEHARSVPYLYLFYDSEEEAD